MPKLSVQVITYNEEYNIRDCLRSIEWAEEILVLDAQSTDRTVEICREFPQVHVVQGEWPGYAAQRNKGLRLTEAEWVLVLDADERVSRELKEEILAAIVNPGNCRGFNISFVYYIGDQRIRERQKRTLRLFKPAYAHFEDRLVHESAEVSGQIRSLTNPIMHFSYRDYAHFIEKHNRYSSLAAQQMHKKGKKSNASIAIAHSIYAFFQIYFLRGRFLADKNEFILSVLHTVYVFQKYVKLWELNRSVSANEINLENSGNEEI